MISALSPVRDLAVTTLDGASSPATINYPDDVEAGDELLLILAFDSPQTIGITGWTELDNRAQGGADQAAVYRREAAGTEGGTTFQVTFTTDNRDVAATVYSLPADGPAELAVAAGSGSVISPPSLSPSGGNRQYWWLQAGVHDVHTITSFSDGFGGWVYNRPPGPSVASWALEQTLTIDTLEPSDLGGGNEDHWVAWTIAVPVSFSPPGNYPVPEGLAVSTWLGGASSHTLDLPPDIEAGDLLVAEIANSANGTPSIPGWTLLVSDTADVHETGSVLYKVADGTEGASVTVTLSVAGLGAGTCRRYSNADATKIDGAIVAHDAGNNSIDPPSLTPADGADDILWQVGSTTDSFGYPNYLPEFPHLGAFNMVDSGVFSGVGAYSEATIDPPVSASDQPRRWVAWTVAIYPELPSVSGSGSPSLASFVSAGAGTVVNPGGPGGAGDNRMGGSGAIRRSPRRRARR